MGLAGIGKCKEVQRKHKLFGGRSQQERKSRVPSARLMALGRENPDNLYESFCMTVLGLKLSRRANAVSALHGEVSRAMWTGLYPGRQEDAIPIGHITNGVHVPTWLAPQMFRLYDRHLGTGWHQHSAEARIWEGIENVDDGELWETHLSLKSRLLEFVRSRAVEQAERRGESPETLQGFGRVLSPDAPPWDSRSDLRLISEPI
jgi:starch phosphorylase